MILEKKEEVLEADIEKMIEERQGGQKGKGLCQSG